MKKFRPEIRHTETRERYDAKKQESLKKLERKQRIRKYIFRFILIAAVVLLGLYIYNRFVFNYARGQVEGERVHYTAPLSGRLVSVDIREFQAIEPGMILARIVNPELQSEFESLKEEIAGIENLMQMEKEGLDYSDSRYSLVELKAEQKQIASEIDSLSELLTSYREKMDIASDAATRAKKLYELRAGTKRLWENRRIQQTNARAELKELESKIQNRRSRLDLLEKKQGFLEKKEKFIDENSMTAGGLRSLDLKLREKNSHLELLRKKIEQGVIRAGKSGRVVNILKNPDSYVTEGTEIIRAVRNERTHIRVYLKPKVAKEIFVGQQARILAAGEQWPGEIMEASDELVPMPRTFRNPLQPARYYAVLAVRILDYENAPEILRKPGLEVTVKILK